MPTLYYIGGALLTGLLCVAAVRAHQWLEGRRAWRRVLSTYGRK